MEFENRNDLPTPALVLDVEALDANLAAMSEVLPGDRLRPHVKAHKCTRIAALQAVRGHRGFTCATAREVIGMAKASLGDDLLLANEIVDPRRLDALASLDARVTVAVASVETIEAAATAGIAEVLIDIDVGLPRCGCAVAEAGALADRARQRGLSVRGVMGYEGHVVGLEDRVKRSEGCATAMQILARAHADVGGDVISAGGTGTFDCNSLATEIQAGSYAVMDTAYAKQGLPFRQAIAIEATVISVSKRHAVCDAGLKTLGMDHGDPRIPGATVWYCSDEHTCFAADPMPKVGNRVRLLPAHCDPTMAYHERVFCLEGERVVDVLEIDLRGW